VKAGKRAAKKQNGWKGTVQDTNWMLERKEKKTRKRRRQRNITRKNGYAKP
jgi:hypothetical protein